MMLKDPIDDVDMVEDAQRDRRILGIQPVEIVCQDLIKPTIRPLLATDEVGIGLCGHDGCPFRLS